MTIIGIIFLVAFIPALVCILNATECLLFEEESLDSFLKFIVLPQYGLYDFAADSVRTSGIVVLMVFSTLIFWPYNVILLGIGTVYMIGYGGYKIFMRLFGKKEEDKE